MKALATKCLAAASLAAIFASPSQAMTRKFRLYRVESGQKIDAEFKFKWSSMSGQVIAKLPTGEQLEGEFNTGHSGAAAWGSIYSSIGGSSGSASGSSVVITGTQGALILAGQEGTTIQCEYVSNMTTTHGNGACIDNHNGHYRMMW